MRRWTNSLTHPIAAFTPNYCHSLYTEWPNEKYATCELSLNRIENQKSIMLDFKIKFECKRILSVGIKYSMRDLVCDAITYCASSFGMGKIKRIRSNRN